MKAILHKTKQILKENIRVLMLFEVLYRLFGIFLIYPLTRFLFNQSVKWAGYTYITNSQLFEYLQKPSTILVIIVLFILISFYFLIEIVYLTVLFDISYHEHEIDFFTFIKTGFLKVISIVKRHHIFVLGNALVIFVILQLSYVSALSSTFALPTDIQMYLDSNPILIVIVYALFIIVVLAFVSRLFSMHYITIEDLSFKARNQRNQRLGRGFLLKHLFILASVVIILNVLFMLIYFVIIIVVGLGVSLFSNQLQALSVVLSIMYTVYVVFGLIATLFLVPFQYAFISVLYYQKRATLDQTDTLVRIKQSKFHLNQKQLKWVLGLSTLFLISLSIPTIITLSVKTNARFELANQAVVVAHRGSSYDAPENTLSAIALALSEGVEIIEIDVHETLDYVPIVIHDASTGRTTNDMISRLVSNLTLDEIKALDAGSWFSDAFIGEQIPTLEEVLLLIGSQTTIFVELKVNSSRLEQSVIAMIDRLELSENVVILSFDLNQLAYIKTLNPEIETLLLLSSFTGNFSLLINHHAIDYFGFSYVLAVSQPSYIEQIHQKRKKVFVYTLNHEAQISEMMGLDIDGVITDRPVYAKTITAQKNKSDFITQLVNQFFGG